MVSELGGQGKGTTMSTIHDDKFDAGFEDGLNARTPIFPNAPSYMAGYDRGLGRREAADRSDRACDEVLRALADTEGLIRELEEKLESARNTRQTIVCACEDGTFWLLEGIIEGKHVEALCDCSPCDLLGTSDE